VRLRPPRRMFRVVDRRLAQRRRGVPWRRLAHSGPLLTPTSGYWLRGDPAWLLRLSERPQVLAGLAASRVACITARGRATRGGLLGCEGWEVTDGRASSLACHRDFAAMVGCCARDFTGVGRSGGGDDVIGESVPNRFVGKELASVRVVLTRPQPAATPQRSVP